MVHAIEKFTKFLLNFPLVIGKEMMGRVSMPLKVELCISSRAPASLLLM